jgi:hypothetical protein
MIDASRLYGRSAAATSCSTNLVRPGPTNGKKKAISPLFLRAFRYSPSFFPIGKTHRGFCYFNCLFSRPGKHMERRDGCSSASRAPRLDLDPTLPSDRPGNPAAKSAKQG